MGGSNVIAAGLSALAGILEREKFRGLETVALSPGAEQLLRNLPQQFKSPASGSAPAPKRSMAPEPSISSGNAPEAVTATVVPPPRSDEERAHPVSEVSGGERTEAWAREELNRIFKAVKNCPECRSLGTLFETVVFASGNPRADIMFVGEAPGAEEEKLKKPFVGPAGQKLEQILKAMGLRREEVYISNIVKFRPKKGDGRFQGSSNRPPQPDEMAASLKYIRAEIGVVRPKVIVALGRTAAEGLLEKGGTLASFRNGDHEFEGIPVIVTYHPSYLLRQEAESDPEQARQAKRAVWEDMLKVMEGAGISISEKQRAYFS